MAYECGCDAVKFQKRTVERVYLKEFLDSPRESPWGTTQREQKNGLEFNRKQYDEIDKYCKKMGIPWFASAWDTESQKFLKRYNLRYNKIASAMIDNEDVVMMVAKERKHTFISTGKADMWIINNIINLFKENNCPLTLMHCVMKYPLTAEECNLNMIKMLKSVYDSVGYSSHYAGILDKSLAVCLGAEVIEAHITLDRASYGTDQPASLEKGGLERVVRDCRTVRGMMG